MTRLLGTCIVTFICLTSFAQSFEQNFVKYSPTGIYQSDAAIDVIDFDGDGDTDIIQGYYTTRDIVLMRNDGNAYTMSILIDSLSQCSAIKTVDFNQDGFDDFIVSANGTIGNVLYLYLNDGNYDYTVQTLPGFSYARSIDALDMDSDGDFARMIHHIQMCTHRYLLLLIAPQLRYCI